MAAVAGILRPEAETAGGEDSEGTNAALARNRDLVDIYQHHWNRLVSPGEAVFTHRGEGAQTLAEACRAGLAPTGVVHRKTVWR